jgi:hypothetical protein
MKVVIMWEGYHLCSKKYNSHTHHTWQGWPEDLKCSNGNPFQQILLMECDYLEVKILQLEHQLRCDPAKEVQQTQKIRMQSHHYINNVRSISSPQVALESSNKPRVRLKMCNHGGQGDQKIMMLPLAK